MTKKEAAKMKQMESEIVHLRAQIDKHVDIYREQLYEIVDLRTRLDLVSRAMDGYEVMP